MKAEMNRQAEQYIRQNKTKSRMVTVVSVLSVLVALLTTYVLMLPGITMEYGMVCGLEEHQHSDLCYATGLVCGQEEREALTTETIAMTCTVQPHQHSNDCFDSRNVRICGQATEVFHTHNDFCYDGDGNLLCSLPNNPPHVHHSDCYKKETRLVCQLAESAGHQHTAECQSQVAATEPACGLAESTGHAHGEGCFAQVLTCTLAESAGHQHDDTCNTVETLLICTEPEAPTHVHGETCVNELGETICGLEEGQGGHTHGDACYTQNILLACGQEAGAGAHTHGDGCYTTQTVCGLAEGDGAHTHTETCYPVTTVYICGKEAGQDAHTHGDACYTTEEKLVCNILHQHSDACFEKDGSGRNCAICGMDQVPEHQHTEACRQVTVQTIEGHTHTEACNGQELVCQLAEHVHEDACYPQEEVVVTATPEVSAEATATPEVSADATATLEVTGEPTITPEVTTEPTPVPVAEETEILYLCGIPEHRHSAECLDATGLLICGYAQDHLHGELCLEDLTNAVFYCGEQEHLHGALCFDAAMNTLCGYDHEHRHSYECLEDPNAVTYYCGLAAHWHEEGCFDENWNLICTLENHEHSTDCRYACGKQEHTHSTTAADGIMMLSLEETFGCYDGEGNLICTLEEHVHGEGCNDGAWDDQNDQIMTLDEVEPRAGIRGPFMSFIKPNGVTVPPKQTVKYDPEKDAYSTALKIEYSITKTQLDSSKQYEYKLPEAVTPNVLDSTFVISDDKGNHVGNYTIEKREDGYYLLIDFLNDIQLQGETGTGSLSFGCAIDQTAVKDDGSIDVKFSDNASLTIENEEIDRSALYNLGIEKTASSYNPVTGTLDYTVTVKSKGTPDVISLKDSLTMENASVKEVKINSIYKDGTALSDSGDQAYSSYCNVYGNGATMDVTLPKVEPSDNETTYVIQYQVTLDSLGDGNVFMNAKNTVAASSGTSPNYVNASDSVQVPYEQKMLEKTGSYDATTDMITWKIVYNTAGKNVAGTALADDMFALLSKENISVDPNTGCEITMDDNDKVTGITFMGDDTNPNTQTYTITYQTKPQQDYTGYEQNIVQAFRDNTFVTQQSAHVNITDRPGEFVTKSLDLPANTVMTNKENMVLPWTVTIGIPGGTPSSNIKVTDTMIDQNNQGRHYMSYDQLYALYQQLLPVLAKDASGTPIMKVKEVYQNQLLDVTTIINDSASYQNAKFAWTELEFDADALLENSSFLTNGTIKFSYNTTAGTNEQNNAFTATNQITVGNKSASEEFQYTPPPPEVGERVNKYCAGCGRDTTECKHSHEIDSFKPFAWTVEVYQDELYDQLTITDTLPEGLELNEVTIANTGLKMTYVNGQLQFSSDQNSGLAIEGNYDATNRKIQLVVKKNGNSIPDYINYGAGKYLTLSVSARLTDDWIPDPGTSQSYLFENTVSATVRPAGSEEDIDIGSDSHPYQMTAKTPILLTKLDTNGAVGDNNTTTVQYDANNFKWTVRVMQDKAYDSLVVTDTLPVSLELTKIQVGYTTYTATIGADNTITLTSNYTSDSEKDLVISPTYNADTRELSLTITRQPNAASNPSSSLAQGKQLDILYYFQIPFEDIAKGEELVYKNTAHVDATKDNVTTSADAEQTQKVNPVQSVKKYGVHNTNQQNQDTLDITNTTGELVWKVTIDDNSDGYENITITDRLPVGVELNPDHASNNNSYNGCIALNGMHGGNWLQWDGASSSLTPINVYTPSESPACQASYDAATGQISITIDKDTWKKLLNGNKTCEVYFYCRLKEDYLPDTEHGQYTVRLENLTNQVSVTVNNGQALGSAAQTQNITVEYPVPEYDTVIKGTPSWNSNSNVLHYQVDINPDHRDMNPAGSNINVIDIAKYLPSGYAGNSLYERELTLKLDTVKLYEAKYNENGEPITTADGRLVIGQEVEAIKWGMDYTESVEQGMEIRKLTLSVPDERALVLVYDYELSIRTEDTLADAMLDLGIENSVKIDGFEKGAESKTSSDDQWHLAYGDGFIVSSSLELVKHDADNLATVLPGVQFQVQQYVDSNNDGEYAWENITPHHSTTTDEQGRLSISQGEGLVENQYQMERLYRIVETASVTGYLSSDEPVAYFYWSDAETTPKVVFPADMNSGSTNVYDISMGGQTIYVPNERYATSQSVEKRWLSTDNSELPASSHPWYTEVELRRYAIPQAEWNNMRDTVNGTIVETQEKTTLTITIANTGNSGHNDDIVQQFDAYVGGSVSFVVAGDKYDWYSLVSSEGTMTKTADNSKYYHNFVVPVVTPNMNITIKVNGWGGDDISTSNCFAIQKFQASNQTHSDTTIYDSLLSGYIDPDYSQTMKLTAESNWKATWSNLPLEGMQNGQLVHYKYFVTETAPNGFTPIISGYSSDEGGAFVVKNIKDGSRMVKTNLRVEKEWYNNNNQQYVYDSESGTWSIGEQKYQYRDQKWYLLDGDNDIEVTDDQLSQMPLPSVKVQLLQRDLQAGANSPLKPYIYNQNETVVIDSSTNWAYNFVDLPAARYNSAGLLVEKYEYFIKEIDDGSSFAVEVILTDTPFIDEYGREYKVTRVKNSAIQNISVTAKKEWAANSQPDENTTVTVELSRLIHTGNGYVEDTTFQKQSQTIDASTFWTCNWTGLPNGKAATDTEPVKSYKYVVTETHVNGVPLASSEYAATYDQEGGRAPANGTVTITNTKTTPVTQMSVVKEWQDANGAVISAPEGSSVTLKLKRRAGADGAEEDVQSVLLGVSNNWRMTIGDLPKFVLKDGAYTDTEYIYYFIEENVPDGFQVLYSNKTADGQFVMPENGWVTVTNQATTTLTLVKQWKNANGTDWVPTAGTSVTFDVMQRSSAGGDDVVHQSISLDGVVDTIETAPWTLILSDLPLTGENGVTYTYYFKEQTLLDGVSVSYSNTSMKNGQLVFEALSSGTITAINTKHQELKIQKKWAEGTEKTDSVQVNLFQTKTPKNVSSGDAEQPTDVNIRFEILFYNAEYNKYEVLETQERTFKSNQTLIWKPTYHHYDNGENWVNTYKPSGSPNVIESSQGEHFTFVETSDTTKPFTYTFDLGTVGKYDKTIRWITNNYFWGNGSSSAIEHNDWEHVFDTSLVAGTNSTLVGRYTLDNTNEWSKTFNETELTLLEDDAYTYTYYIEEVGMEGYKVTYDNNGVNEGTISMTNAKGDVPVADTVSLYVNKEWLDAEGNSIVDTLPADMAVTLKLMRRAGADGTPEVVTEYDSITLNGTANWEATIDGLPKFGVDANGSTVQYEYYFVEDAMEGYTVSYSNSEDGINFTAPVDGKVTVTNTNDEPVTPPVPSTQLVVEKRWGEGARKKDVQFKLYRRTWASSGEGTVDMKFIVKWVYNNTAQSQPYGYTVQVGNKVVWVVNIPSKISNIQHFDVTYGDQIIKMDGEGDEWTNRDMDGDGYITYTSDPFTVLETVTDVVWDTQVSTGTVFTYEQSVNISVDAYEVGTYTIPVADGQYIFDDLPASDDEGNTYYYFVEEVDTGKYQVSYENNAGVAPGEGPIIIINNPLPSQNISVTVKKTWQNADGEAMSEPSTYAVNYEIWATDDETKAVATGSLPEDGEWKATHTLPAGKTYYVVETSILNGDQEMKNFYDITYSAGENGTPDAEPQKVTVDADGTLNIINRLKPTYVLPETGGIGTHLYTRAGALLTSIALTLLYKRNQRKRRANE